MDNKELQEINRSIEETLKNLKKRKPKGVSGLCDEILNDLEKKDIYIEGTDSPITILKSKNPHSDSIQDLCFQLEGKTIEIPISKQMGKQLKEAEITPDALDAFEEKKAKRLWEKLLEEDKKKGNSKITPKSLKKQGAKGYMPVLIQGNPNSPDAAIDGIDAMDRIAIIDIATGQVVAGPLPFHNVAGKLDPIVLARGADNGHIANIPLAIFTGNLGDTIKDNSMRLSPDDIANLSGPEFLNQYEKTIKEMAKEQENREQEEKDLSSDNSDHKETWKSTLDRQPNDDYDYVREHTLGE